MKGGLTSCLSKGTRNRAYMSLPASHSICDTWFLISGDIWFLVVGKRLNVKRNLRRGTKRMVRLNGTNVGA